MANRREYVLSDYGNGERLRDREHDRLCYVPGIGYHVYGGVRWQPDEEQARGFAQASARSHWDDIHSNGEVSAVLVKHALRSESTHGISAALMEARTLLAVSAEKLDRDPWIFNVQNGSLDLHKGELRDHDPRDYCTKLAPVKFDPRAEASLWERFIAEIMDDNADLMHYLNKLCGMFLTGDVSAQELYIAWGGGANGKSVLFDTLAGLMGDYAGKVADSLLTGFGGHPTEVADLHGMRLGIGSETEEGARLRVQMIKQLTGDQWLKARRMRQDFYQFPRTHKLVMITNNRPVIRENTEAVWRRLRLIPFSVTIPPERRDPNLIERLKREWPGILNWCVRGCLAWQHEGLKPPAEVLIASEEYRHDQDTLSEFIAEHCVRFDGARASRADAWEAYSEWAKRTGERHPLDRGGLFDRIRRVQGVTDAQWKVNGTPVRGFKGIGITKGTGTRTPYAETEDEEEEVTG